MNGNKEITRRDFIKAAGAGLFLAGLHCDLPLPAWALTANAGIEQKRPKSRYDLTLGYSPLRIDGSEGTATAVNGTVPGPLVHLLEGDDVVVNVTNRLSDQPHSSVHWHGILVPFPMDGVPGVNFKGIRPGETYEYRYRVKQAGTDWLTAIPGFRSRPAPTAPDHRSQGGEPFD